MTNTTELKKLEDVFSMGFILKEEYEERKAAILRDSEEEYTEEPTQQFSVEQTMKPTVPGEPEETLADLEVMCPNAFSGCGERCEQSMLWKHLEECPFFGVPCHLCDKEGTVFLLRGELYEHLLVQHSSVEEKTVCPNRVNGCSWSGGPSQVNAHFEKCLAHITLCGDCREEFSIHELTQHHADVHAEQPRDFSAIVSCPNAAFGCQEQVQQSRMGDHLGMCRLPCPVCGVHVSRYEAHQHFEMFHPLDPSTRKGYDSVLESFRSNLPPLAA